MLHPLDPFSRAKRDAFHIWQLSVALVAAAASALATASVLSAQQAGFRSLDDTIAVFEIHASGCTHGRPRQQTGFVLTGVNGLYTALHGVVGCKTIDAFRRSGVVTLTDLVLEQVDIDRDAALLSNDHLTDLLETHQIGGQLNESLSELKGNALLVVGHASATPRPFTSPLRIDHTTKYISDVVPGGSQREMLQVRGSPLLTTRVLTHSGPLGPGHSGAPILDGSTERVVAFGEGGVVGAKDITFSIPLEDIQFRPAASVASALSRLAEQGSEGMFAFEPSEYRPEALRPSLIGAAGFAGGQVDLRLRVQAPLLTGATRLHWAAEVALFAEQSTQAFETLPGIAPNQLAETTHLLYVGPGVAYYPRSVPHGALDPYVRAAALISKHSTFDFGGEVALGCDIRVLGPFLLVVEASGTELRVPLTLRTFNRYGDATVTKSSDWSSHFRLYIGSGTRLSLW